MKTVSAIVIIAAIVMMWPQHADPLPGFPRVFLWAWERPENLDFLDPQSTGVAFLARTVFLKERAVSVRPRLNPLRYTPGATLMGVVRVESDSGPLPAAAPVAAAIADAAFLPGVRALQVDFDATLSQREFYRDVLRQVRGRIPAGLPLSITALQSWCDGDYWMEGLPIAEAVPMLFRLGPGERPRREFRHSLCRGSAGVSLDELLPAPPVAARLYVFNPRPWTRDDFRTAMAEVRRWH